MYETLCKSSHLCAQFPLLKWGSVWFLHFIFYFSAALCLHCCRRAFSSCSERGLLFVAVRELLIAVASLVAEHGL